MFSSSGARTLLLEEDSSDRNVESSSLGMTSASSFLLFTSKKSMAFSGLRRASALDISVLCKNSVYLENKEGYSVLATQASQFLKSY
jgi:hypothetical protein